MAALCRTADARDSKSAPSYSQYTYYVSTPPWVRCPNLGSKVLALCARRLGADFCARYGYAPVLLESFVECPRFTGGVYRAANWQCVGHTQGRGRNSRSHAASLPVKAVWLYPLSHDFRAALAGGPVA